MGNTNDFLSCESSGRCVPAPLGWLFPQPLVSSPHGLISSQLKHEGGRSPQLSLWAAPSSQILCPQTPGSMDLHSISSTQETGSTGGPSLCSSLKTLSRKKTGAIKGSFLRRVSSLRGHCSVLSVVQCLKSMVSYILSIVLVVSSERVVESGPCYSILDGSEVPVFVFLNVRNLVSAEVIGIIYFFHSTF